jgi:hypothetical protein
MESPGAMLGEHPLGPAQEQRMNKPHFPRHQVAQLPSAHAEDAAVAPKPKVADIVLDDLRNDAVRQTVFRPKTRQPPILPPAQAAAYRPNPQHTFRIPEQRANIIVR